MQSIGELNPLGYRPTIKTKKMRLLIILLLILSLSSNVFSQGSTISGKVYNDFNETVCYVSITNGTSKAIVFSDKNGKFKIKVALNDTLSFIKDKYLIKKIIINNFNKKRVTIDFNYNKAIEELDNNTLDIAFPFGCNPLLVINGDVSPTYDHDKSNKLLDGIKRTDLNIIILKGKDATDKFGKYANNGLFWITLKCK